MKFTFSEQKESTSSEPEHPTRGKPKRNSTPPRKREAADERLRRLKEAAPSYGWEFDEARGVLRPLSPL